MRFSKTYRRIAWLIVAALLVQPWLSQKAVATAAETLNTLVICTGTGFKAISLPVGFMPPGSPAETPNHHDTSAANCPACLVQALGQFDGVARLDDPSSYRYWIVEAAVTDRWTAEPLCHRPLHSRAPPTI